MNADWLPVGEARRAVLDGVRPLGSERAPLLSALGRVLAEELLSPVDLPPWDNSGMDGYATRADDVRGATPDDPRLLTVIEEVAAGAFPTRPVTTGTASRIMTGAPLPDGADGVVRLEHTDGGVGPVRIGSGADAGKNVRRRGEDVRRGELVLEAGRRIRAAEIGVAASLGRAELQVVRRPVVAVLASGDELVELDRYDEVLAGRRIVSSNSYALAALLAESASEARILGIAADDPRSVREHLERAAGCDALITTAGISVGAHDYVRDVLLEMGLETRFWRVRMRPGSPFGFGAVGALGGIPWFGLPGNPVSCMVTYELFVRPALLRMAGMSAPFAPTVLARFLDEYPQAPGLTHFVRVRLGMEDGSPTARLTGAQGSGILTSMAAADGLMVVPEEAAGASAGDVLPVVVLGGAPARSEPGY